MVSTSLIFVVLMLAWSQLPSTEGGIVQCWGIGEDQRVGLCIANKKLCGPDEVEISQHFSNCDPETPCCTSAPPAPLCVGSAVAIGTQCLTFHTEGDALTWAAAAAVCSANGGRLATLERPQDVYDYVTQNYPWKAFWVGASDAANEGRWLWTSGRPLDDQFPWKGTEPNGGTNSNCMYMYRGYGDGPCSNINRPICEAVKVECATAAGFFKIPGSSKCYFLLTDKSSWEDSKQKCEDRGLQLATKPDKPVELRKIIVEQHGINQRIWIGGRGTGTVVAWVLHGTIIPDNSPLWNAYTYHNTERKTTANCLNLMTETQWLPGSGYAQPSKPYFMDDCAYIKPALCELVK